MLIGFMGSGKTTIARLLADALEWECVDLDEVIERDEGRAIPVIFEDDGEAGFRRIEHAAATRLLRRDGIVLASGGGWPCAEGRLEALPTGTLTIWLQVSAEEALRRVRAQGIRRPLLEVPDPMGRIAELTKKREGYYKKADWWMDTERYAPVEIVSLVTERLRKDAERPSNH